MSSPRPPALRGRSAFSAARASCGRAPRRAEREPSRPPRRAGRRAPCRLTRTWTSSCSKSTSPQVEVDRLLRSAGRPSRRAQRARGCGSPGASWPSSAVELAVELRRAAAHPAGAGEARGERGHLRGRASERAACGQKHAHHSRASADVAAAGLRGRACVEPSSAAGSASTRASMSSSRVPRALKATGRTPPRVHAVGAPRVEWATAGLARKRSIFMPRHT